jgi:dimethylargininase
VPLTALVRDVSPRLAEAELTHLDRALIDVDLARSQHASYADLLRALGADVVALPPLPEHPDGVFVEDVAVVVPEVAVVTRPGAASRRGEVAGLADLLRELRPRVEQLAAPATLDGGDVLRVGSRVLVGRSSRTNDHGVAALAALLEPLGYDVHAITVQGYLHLKTAATALPDGTYLAASEVVAESLREHGDVVVVPEPSGADVLLVRDSVVVAASAPRTAQLVAARGWQVHTVDIGELEKAEAGVTCLSVLLRT